MTAANGKVVTGRLRSVDALRGLAALAVVLMHIPHLGHLPICGRRLLFLPFEFGSLGVYLFLVISGFCIHLSVAQQLACGETRWSWLSFWRRRLRRLYFPYLAAVAFSLFCFLLCNLLDPRICDWTGPRALALDLGTHLLLIHNLFPAYMLNMCNAAFWSLGLEEQLYALYALFLLARIRLGLSRVLLATFAVSLGWFLTRIVAPLLNGDPAMASRYFPWPFTWWAVWMLGVLAAENHAGVIRLPEWCYQWRVALPCACAGIVLYHSTFSVLGIDRLLARFLGERLLARLAPQSLLLFECLSFYAFSLVFFIALNRAIRAERCGQWDGRMKNWLAKIGVISYSLYLTHLPIIRVSEHVFERLGIGQTILSTLLRYAVIVPISLAFAHLFYKLIESRFLNSVRATPRLDASLEAMKQAA